MPFIGGGHLIYIIFFLVIVLIIFGPGKLPEIGAGAGKAIREFRRATSEMRDSATGGAAPSETSAAPPAGPPHTSEPGSPAAPISAGTSAAQNDQRPPA